LLGTKWHEQQPHRKDSEDCCGENSFSHFDLLSGDIVTVEKVFRTSEPQSNETL
jgi:hypothetical protein